MRAVILCLALLLGFMPPAAGLDGTEFNPGYIMSDDVFFDADAMTPAEVRGFITTQGQRCQPGPDGTPCLKDYVESTPDVPARHGCLAHAGRADEPSWTIISDVARECGINPQVLLVLLQKEQGLITASGATLTPLRYERATGLSCPDGPGGPICDPAHGGFYKQVRGAAERFNMYKDASRYPNYRPGRTSMVLYNPDRTCGSAPVYIENFATTALYTYTPFQPNEAALTNLYGSGDRCSSYGNRNFWRNFAMWFGDPTGGEPAPSQACIVRGDCRFYLAYSWTTRHADVAFRSLEQAPGTALAGDWNGDGIDDVAVRSGTLMTLFAHHYTSAPFMTYIYGRDSDDVFVGDWDGDGIDTPAVRRGNTWYVTNALGSTRADIVFTYGKAGDTVLVGDWNGDGIDTFAVRRGNTLFLLNSSRGGHADQSFTYGKAGDTILVGDWNGDGLDTFAVRRSNAYFIKNSMTSGNADLVQRYGTATDQVIVGDWDGDLIDTLGVYRPSV